MSRIGIFGGSFNPIHCGHIALARQLRTAARLDEVWLMVSPQNPLKQGSTELIADHLRYEMACLALQGEEGIVASDYELHLPRPSYTWNTLQHLSRDYPSRTFLLIMGGDNWAYFERWRHWKDILRHYEVVVYPRDQPPAPSTYPCLTFQAQRSASVSVLPAPSLASSPMPSSPWSASITQPLVPKVNSAIIDHDYADTVLTTKRTVPSVFHCW